MRSADAKGKSGKGMRQKPPSFRAGSALWKGCLHAVVGKRLETVIRTDGSLSPKPSQADGKSRAALKSSDQLGILERSYELSLCADLPMQGHAQETRSISHMVNPEAQVSPSTHRKPPAARAICIQNITDTSNRYCYAGLKESPGMAAMGSCCHREGRSNRADVPLAQSLNLAQLLAPGDVPYTAVSVPASRLQRGGSGRSRRSPGTGGGVVRPPVHCSCAEEGGWHRPSHTATQPRAPAPTPCSAWSCPFPAGRSSNSFIPVDESH